VARCPPSLHRRTCCCCCCCCCCCAAVLLCCCAAVLLCCCAAADAMLLVLFVAFVVVLLCLCDGSLYLKKEISVVSLVGAVLVAVHVVQYLLLFMTVCVGGAGGVVVSGCVDGWCRWWLCLSLVGGCSTSWSLCVVVCVVCVTARDLVVALRHRFICECVLAASLCASVCL